MSELNESSNEQLQRLAASYRTKLPMEDEASLRTLAGLCDRMEPLQRVADHLTQSPAPESDEAIAMCLAVQYALQAVLRVGRRFVIQNSGPSR